MRFSVYQQKEGVGFSVRGDYYGSESYKLSDFFEYHRVATIEADDLEEVFHIGNGMGRQDPGLGSLSECTQSVSGTSS